MPRSTLYALVVGIFNIFFSFLIKVVIMHGMLHKGRYMLCILYICGLWVDGWCPIHCGCVPVHILHGRHTQTMCIKYMFV